MARSTARASGPMSRRFSPPRSSQMDNLGSHRGKAVRQAIRPAGATLFFLPKYSPDLNPIEQFFAKLKHLLRKEAARTPQAIAAALARLLDAFTPQECENYFKEAGYKLT